MPAEIFTPLVKLREALCDMRRISGNKTSSISDFAVAAATPAVSMLVKMAVLELTSAEGQSTFRRMNEVQRFFNCSAP